MTQQIQHMLMFSLGPVQSLIVQARKTRDLWLGSYLISKLMESGMEVMDDEAFVFPTKRKIKDDIPDLPNKFIAIFNSPEDAEKAATRTEERIAAKWKTICNNIRLEFIGNNYISDVKETWERQTKFESFFEVFWVVVPGSLEDYQNWLKVTILALDTRKRLRNFLPQDEPGEKSTVSGEREALHGPRPERGEVRRFWRHLTETAPHRISAKDISKDGSERLDAIDTIKRFALYSPELKPKLDRIDFPSTSSVAAASLVNKLLEKAPSSETLQKVLENWKVATKDLAEMPPGAISYLATKAKQIDYEWILERDGDCYFEEAYTSRYFEENYLITDNPEEQKREKERGLNLKLKSKDFIPNCLQALGELLKAVGTRPTPYYALIQMDGDNMGSIINNVAGRKEHTDISQALSTFAREKAPEIVQNTHPGRLVYSGGDDTVAFTPLEGMLEMVEALNQKYNEILREAVVSRDKGEVTASLGIAIAHHFTPLSLVRRAALEAEKLAKRRYGRNAFVITVIRHSGEQTRVGCRWYYTDPQNETLFIEPMTLFKKFYGYFAKDILSPKSIHALLSEASSLVWLDRPEQRSEIKRVLKRQRNDQKKDQLPDEEIASLAERIVKLAEAMDKEIQQEKEKRKREQGKDLKVSVELHEDELRYGLIETFGWLLVMAFLGREALEK